MDSGVDMAALMPLTKREKVSWRSGFGRGSSRVKPPSASSPCTLPDVQFRMYVSGCTVPDVQFEMYSSGCTVPDAQFRMHSSGYTVPDV